MQIMIPLLRLDTKIDDYLMLENWSDVDPDK
jgi:hypothetical protein